MSKALYQLLSWFSPAFPTGSYAYSHGLENAIQSGQVCDRETLFQWIKGVISFGDIFQDGVIIKESHSAFDHIQRLRDIAVFSIASRVTQEKALEDESQAKAFVKNLLATQTLLPLMVFVKKSKEWQLPFSYPVVCGIATASQGICVNDAILAYTHAFIANMVSVALRSIPLGQTEGLHVLMKAGSGIDDDIKRILETPLDESGSANFLLDIYSSRHEVQNERLFRS